MTTTLTPEAGFELLYNIRETVVYLLNSNYTAKKENTNGYAKALYAGQLEFLTYRILPLYNLKTRLTEDYLSVIHNDYEVRIWRKDVSIKKIKGPVNQNYIEIKGE